MKFNAEATLILSGKASPAIQTLLSILLICILASYDSSVRVWDCRSRTHEPVQMMTEARDSVSSLQLSSYEILTG